MEDALIDGQATKSLLSFGVRLLPPGERSRWREEWLAEMEAEPSNVRLKLWFSLNIAVAAVVMAWEGRSRRALSRHGPGHGPPRRSVMREGFSRSFWC